MNGSGKAMPLNEPPEKRVVVTGYGLPLGEPFAEVLDTYVSHFATCPNADKHRTKPT
jgi:hypothetical protein